MSDVFVITGAAGFIGSHLARTLLARNPSTRIIGIDNFDHFYPREMKLANVADLTARLQLLEADIRDAKAVQGVFAQHKPQAVFHLAALAGVRPSIADPARYVSVNLDGTINLLEAARNADCTNFIFASSSSVYGNNKKVPFAETDPVHEPISPYAATKAAGELICHTHAHLFNMRIAALRFFTVFGPNQRPDLAIASFMRKIALDEEIPMFGDGSTSRDYTYIDDIIEGVIAAYEKVSGLRRQASSDVAPPRPGQSEAAPAAQRRPGSRHPSLPAAQDAPFFRIYNLGGNAPITLRDMIARIEDVVGRKASIRRLPMQPGDVERTWADLTRSRSELGYQPRTAFVEGLRKQWDAMKSRLAHASA